MNKKILLLGCLTISFAHASSSHSKKTFLMPRASGVNAAMEYSAWHNHILNTQNKKNSHFATSVFYQTAIKGTDTGKYFGIGNGKNSFAVGTPGAGIDLTNRFLIHKYDDDSALAGTITLNPKQEVYGLRFDFVQYMQHPIKNGFLKVSFPFVRTENDLNFKVDNETADANSNTLEMFFRGDDIDQPAAADAQDALTHGKITTGQRSHAGPSDVDVSLGYKFVEKENRHLFASIGVTLPTGNKARGVYLFEPIYGNGDHFGVGFSVDGSLRLWNKERHSARLLFASNYRYLIEGTEKRTIPIKSITYPLAHYYLTGKVGSPANTNLIPAANLLTRNMHIRPGNQIDSILALNFKSKRFLIDVGYNLFIKEGEAVRLKEKWEDDTYAIAAQNFNVTAVFVRTDTADHKAEDLGNNTLMNKTLDNSDLDLAGVSTPSQLTHKAFASIGYTFDIAKNPASMSFGASYEYAENNSALEGYAFWTKLGLSF